MRTIWLASYPKSGNTWMRVLLANLTADGDQAVDINRLPGGIASARGPFDRLTLIDSSLLSHAEIDALRPRVHAAQAAGDVAGDDDDEERDADLPVRFVKVHDAYLHAPGGEPLLAGARAAAGAIVIVRDPRDVAPSLANHSRFGIDEAIAFMNDAGACFSGRTDRAHLQLRQRLLTWSAHIASWLSQTDIPVHLVRYEDLQADTERVLRDALVFAQHEASAAQIARAARLAGFAQLRAQEQAKGFREAPRSRPGGRFFRRGEAGAWRDELTLEQVARIEERHAAMMQRLGYALTGAPRLAEAG